MQGTCIQTIRNGDGKIPYHTDEIQCFDLHPTRPLILTGDCAGGVFGAHYGTGEVVGQVGSHKDSVESVVISKELQFAASAGIDTTIIVYDLKDSQVRHRIDPI